MQKHCKSFKLTLLFKKHVSNSSCVSKWASKYFPMCQSSQSLGKRAFQTEYKKEHSQRVVGYDYSFYSALLRMYLTDCLEPALQEILTKQSKFSWGHLRCLVIYVERLRKLSIFNVGKRGLKVDLCIVLSCFDGNYRQEWGRHTLLRWWAKCQDISHRLQQGKFQLDIRRKFFVLEVIKHWRKFSRNLVELPFLGIFRIWLAKAVCTWFKPEVSPALNRCLELLTSRRPFQPKFFSDSMKMELFFITVFPSCRSKFRKHSRSMLFYQGCCWMWFETDQS